MDDALKAKTTDIDTLLAIVELLAAVANDTQEVVAGQKGKLASFVAYGDLLPKFLALLPKLGEIPTEVHDLSPEDITFLVSALVAKLNIKSVHARNVLDASIDTLNALALHVADEVEKLVAAVKGA